MENQPGDSFQIFRPIATVALAIALVSALYVARQALLLVYVSALLAIGFNPLVRLIERQKLLPIGSRHLPRWLAIFLVYLVILIVLVGFGFVVIPVLVDQARELAKRLPTMFEQAQQYLLRHRLISKHLTVRDIIQEQVPSEADALSTVLFTFWNLLGGVIGVFSIVVLSSYFLIESRSLFDGFLRLFPRSKRGEIEYLSSEITTSVSAWLGGQMLLSAIIGATTATGLGLLGVPYFYVLSLVAAAGELVPYFGPVFAAVPGIAIALSISWGLALAVAVFYFLQQQLESQIIVPRVFAHRMHLSPAVVIIALLVGDALLGVVGAVLAIPTAAILQVIVQNLVTSRQ